VKRLFTQMGLVLVVAVVAATALVPAATGAPSRVTKPLAGPWYTPKELKALIRYSNASFAEKQAILAGTAEGSHHA
jgi:heme A synthase